MATLNISLPDEMKAWIEKQSRLGSHTNSSDYIRDLVLKDQRERGVFRKVPVHIFGSTITVVGDFGQVAIGRDINLRGGHATRQLTQDTKYILTGESLNSNDHALITQAETSGIPCINLNHYEAELPDGLEMMGN